MVGQSFNSSAKEAGSPVVGLDNLTFYWFAYPVIIWMLIGIGLVIHQLWTSHQFLYQRFWPRFWQLTVFFWLVAFVLSLLGNRLPVV